MNKLKTGLLLMSLAIMGGCKKDSSEPVQQFGEINIEFDYRAGNEGLILNAVQYITKQGDTIKPNSLKYYVSNIELIKNDGSVLKVSGKYLVDEYDEKSRHLSIKDVPTGLYNMLSFQVGLDSIFSAELPDTGIYSADRQMRYGNNSPVMFKLEGSYNSGKPFKFWLTSFEVELTKAPQDSIKVVADKECKVHLYVDIMELFNGHHHQISIADHPIVTSPGVVASAIAENGHGMFSINHIHNY